MSLEQNVCIVEVKFLIVLFQNASYRMKQFHLLILGVVCTSSILFGQTNHRISIQTGLFHHFFDGSPILNLNYQNKLKKPFNGLLINSQGLNYAFRLNAKSAVSLDCLYFFEQYTKNIREANKNSAFQRGFLTFTLNYERKLKMNSLLNFVYGSGVSYRYGREVIIVNFFISGNGQKDFFVEASQRSDMGINLFSGIEYTPTKRITLFGKIDFLGFVYRNATFAKKEFKEVYDAPQYPSRFDLSLRLGIGYNF